eukprot:scaffold60256_cov55-Attheya_sp.AAC.1
MQSTSQSTATEISLKAALERLVNDETLADVTLEGSDGVKVVGNRGLLAARSRVFRCMLFGSFVEASEKVVNIGYTGGVVSQIVKYCLTDTLVTEQHDFQSGTIVSLADAARFFELPVLMKMIADRLQCEMLGDLQLACPILQASMCQSSCLENIANECLKLIRFNPEATLMQGSALYSIQQPQILERILYHNDMRANEITLFRILKRWADYEVEISGESESRMEIASKLVPKMRLDEILPSDLSATVAPSGLVADMDILNAYKSQATKFESKYGTIIAKPSRLKCWAGSQSDVFNTTSLLRSAIVDNAIMTSGVHEWSIFVSRDKTVEHSVFLGVVSSANRIDVLRSIFKYRGSWAVKDSGDKWKHGVCKSYSPNMEYGYHSLVVSFILDLSCANNSNGILRISVNGAPSVVVFKNMLDKRDEKDNFGFVPAVFSKHGSFRLLSFRRL